MELTPINGLCTAVHAACEYGKDKCLQLLIRRGANLEIIRDPIYPSPIDLALSSRHPACIGLLLANGAYFITGDTVDLPDGMRVCLYVCMYLCLFMIMPFKPSGDIQGGSDHKQDGREA